MLKVLHIGDRFHYDGKYFQREGSRLVELHPHKGFSLENGKPYRSRRDFYYMLVRGGFWLNSGRFIWGDNSFWLFQDGTYHKYDFDRCRTYSIVPRPAFAEHNYAWLDDQYLYNSGRVITIRDKTAITCTNFTANKIVPIASLDEISESLPRGYSDAVIGFEVRPYREYFQLNM